MRIAQLTPTELRQMADALEDKARKECTGLTAAWCPIHGDCRCDREQSLDAWDCPLHKPESSHEGGVDN